MAYRAGRLSLAAMTIFIVMACAGSPSLSPTPADTLTSSPVPTASASLMPAPSQTPSPTAPPSPTPSPSPSSTAPASMGAWQQVPDQPSVRAVQFDDVVWTGARFVAIGVGDRGARFLDSLDGIVWHSQSGRRSGARRLAAGPGGVVAVGAIDGRLASWTSADGLTWRAHPRAFPPALDGSRLDEDAVAVTDVVADGSGWLAVGRRDPACQIDCGDTPSRAYVWRSNDGAHWVRVPDQKALRGGGMDTVARGDGWFVAAGIASGHAAIWTSRDGVRWRRVQDAPMFHVPKSSDWAYSLGATGAAVRDGVMVVVGSAYAQDVCPPGRTGPSCPGARAWWSADGRRWSKATIEKAVDGQMSSATATSDGFLATGPSGGRSCRGGVWSSTDGRAWDCLATGRKFRGFAPSASAASETIEVAVGFDDSAQDADPDAAPVGAVWYRQRP